MKGTIKVSHAVQDGNISIDEILQGVTVLDTKKIVEFMHEVGKIIALRNAESLSQRESQLLKSINQSIPDKLQTEYDMLSIKLNEEQITIDEYDQLLKLISKIEQKREKKLEFMIELAHLRNVSLKELGQQLQTQVLAYA